MIRLSSTCFVDNDHKLPNNAFLSSLISIDDTTSKFSLHFTDKKREDNAENHGIKTIENDPKTKDLNDVIEIQCKYTNQNRGVCRYDRSGSCIHNLTDDEEDIKSNIGDDKGKCISQMSEDKSCTSLKGGASRFGNHQNQNENSDLKLINRGTDCFVNSTIQLLRQTKYATFLKKEFSNLICNAPADIYSLF